MDLLVITDTNVVDNEAWLINNLFDAGLQRLHLRKPYWNSSQFIDLLSGIKPFYYPFIALHQHHYLAEQFGINRLHYPESQRINTDAEIIRLQKKDGYLLSTSVHDLNSLPSLEIYEYVFLSPVFDSISKKGYLTNLPADLKLTKSYKKPRVIALGGVELSNLGKLKIMGFDGAAVLGTLWNEPDKALERFLHLKEHLSI